jgi:hypothetical protein
VEVEPLDAVEVEQWQHGPQRGQQHPVLYLEILDGLQNFAFLIYYQKMRNNFYSR